MAKCNMFTSNRRIHLILLINCILMILTLRVKAVDKSLLYSFNDNITEGSIVANIKVDSDLSNRYSRDRLAKAHFSFLQLKSYKHEKNYDSYFDLKNSTGLLNAVNNIDRDDLCPGLKDCIIKLDIACRLPAKDFEVIRVIITLEDFNDNPPVFEDKHLEFGILESVSPGVILHVQQATDKDSPSNGIDRYTLISADQNMFRLETAKSEHDNFEIKIWLLTQLDREHKFRHELVLIAHDGGYPSLSGKVIIVLNIKDINDNSPRFLNSSLSVKVIEGTQRGTMLAQLHAVDLDSGTNGKIMYFFTNQSKLSFGHFFKIKAYNGKIILRRSLDYEVQNMYTLDVIAKDLGENSIPAEAKVFINVIDVNDNDPVITIQPQYKANLVVLKNALQNTFVAHISAHDKDSHQNGFVTCSLDNNSYHVFNLLKTYNGEYKLVTKISLNIKNVEKYLINITCKDEGIPPRSSTLLRQVIVIDVKDHVPKFEKNVYACTLYENSPPHTSLIRVLAKESDSGLSGSITYKLGPRAGKLFKVNDTTGLIEAIAPLDRETIGDVLNFYVLAIDHAIIPQTSTATVRVKVLDKDDKRPEFSQKKYIFSVYENIPGVSSVGFVYAKDLDTRKYSQYSFYINETKTDESWFSIAKKRGEIFAKKPFDREQKNYHNVYVVVQSDENLNFYDTCLVQILIADRNDNVPNITFPSINNNKVYVDNKIKVGTVIDKSVKARDQDEGLNGKLMYYFQNNNSPFMVDEYTGKINITRDVSSYVHEQFPVKVIVRDRGNPKLQATAIINLIVTNKLSQQNLWDETRQTRDKGMPMVLRIVIVCAVVILAITIILALSMLIRFVVTNTKCGGIFCNLKWQGSYNVTNNGHIPSYIFNTIQTKKYEYEEYNRQSETPLTGQGQYILNSHRKRSYCAISSCPEISDPEDFQQVFLPELRQLPKLTGKSHNTFMPPELRVTYTSSASSQSSESSETYQDKLMPLINISRKGGIGSSSKYKQSVCFQSDFNITKCFESHRNRRNDAMTGHIKSNTATILNTPIKINTSNFSKDSLSQWRIKATASSKFDMHNTNKKHYKNSEITYPKHMQYNVFQQDPWDYIHLQKDNLKHSIPGHCTIIDISKSNSCALESQSKGILCNFNHITNVSNESIRPNSFSKRISFVPAANVFGIHKHTEPLENSSKKKTYGDEKYTRDLKAMNSSLNYKCSYTQSGRSSIKSKQTKKTMENDSDGSYI